MARIRTIKPEFWDSEDTAAASLRARLLYIAMWNWADDYGIGDATPIRLLGFAFPHDDLSVSEIPTLCGEISERFGVVFYRHHGRSYYYIPSFDTHQRTEKKAKQRVPYPHDLENPEIAGAWSNSVGKSAPSVGNTVTGTGEEGTGEQGKKEHTRPKGRAAKDDDPTFDIFWDAYPKKVAKGQARKAWPTAVKKAGPDKLVAAAVDYAAWVRSEGTESRYIANPATWLNGERWTDERPARAAKPTNVSAHLALVQQLAEQDDAPRQIGPA